MHIDLSGHHVEITDAIREAVHTKLEKIQSHYPHIDAINVIVSVEKKSQNVEMTTQFLGAPIAVHASESDLYAAIASGVKKLDAKLAHKKGANKAHLHDKPILADNEEDDVL